LRKLAVVCQYWKVASNFRLRTAVKGEPSPELRSRLVSGVGKDITLESKKSNREGNERVKLEFDTFMRVADPPPIRQASSRKRCVRSPCAARLVWPCRACKGPMFRLALIEFPGAGTEREANSGVKLRYVPITTCNTEMSVPRALTRFTTCPEPSHTQHK
jgi:hypothetical protein